MENNSDLEVKLHHLNEMNMELRFDTEGEDIEPKYNEIKSWIDNNFEKYSPVYFVAWESTRFCLQSAKTRREIKQLSHEMANIRRQYNGDSIQESN